MSVYNTHVLSNFHVDYPSISNHQFDTLMPFSCSLDIMENAKYSLLIFNNNLPSHDNIIVAVFFTVALLN